MMNYRSLVLAAPCLMALSACNPGGEGRMKVAVVTNNPADFWNMCEDGARDAGQKYAVDVEFRRPSPGTAAEQKKIIDALLNLGVQGLAVSVIDPQNQTDYLNGVAARAKLLTQDNDAPESERVCYIGTDNYAAGRAAGELVKEAMPEGGTVAIFVGQINPLNAQQRYQGVVDVLAGATDAKGPKFGAYTQHGPIYTDDVDQKKAKENARALLGALADKIDAGEPVCLVGLWAYNPPAILSAVEEKGLVGKVKIVGFDEDRATLAGVADGKIVGTVVQNPYKFGFESVRLMVGLARGRPIEDLVPDGEEVYHVTHRVFTREGGNGRYKAAEFDEEYQKQREEMKALQD